VREVIEALRRRSASAADTRAGDAVRGRTTEPRELGAWLEQAREPARSCAACRTTFYTRLPATVGGGMVEVSANGAPRSRRS
jgi:hypothetical protein